MAKKRTRGHGGCHKRGWERGLGGHWHRWRGWTPWRAVWEGRFADVDDGLATGIRKRDVLRMILRCLTSFTVTGDIRDRSLGVKFWIHFWKFDPEVLLRYLRDMLSLLELVGCIYDKWTHIRAYTHTHIRCLHMCGDFLLLQRNV